LISLVTPLFFILEEKKLYIFANLLKYEFALDSWLFR